MACRDKETIRELKINLRDAQIDKTAFLQKLEERENNIKARETENERYKNFLEEKIKNKAYEIEKNTISNYNKEIDDYKNKCEEEKSKVISEYMQLINSEKEKIKEQADKQAEIIKAEFDEEYANRQKELDEDYQRKQKELDDNNQTEKEQMIASSKKYKKLCSFEYTKCGAVVILCLVCALIGVYSFIIALCHGLLPTLIDDGKSFISWITTNWKGMFHSPFDFSNVRSIFNLLIPLVILALSVIWTIYDYDYEDKEWVIMADGDKVSIAVLGSAISLSAFFGKWISAIHINTVVLPFIIYEIYFLIRSGFITRLLEIIFTIISSILEAAIDKLSEKKSNEIVGSLLLIVIIGAAAIWFFSLFKK